MQAGRRIRMMSWLASRVGDLMFRTWDFWSSRFRYRLLEWYMAVSMFFCGFILLLAGHTFALSPYMFIRQLASENIWGQLLLIVGGFRIIALGFNGLLPHGTPHVRVALAIVAVIIWSELAAGYLASGVPSLMIGMVVPATLFEAINAYRAALDASVEDSGGKAGGGT